MSTIMQPRFSLMERPAPMAATWSGPRGRLAGLGVVADLLHRPAGHLVRPGGTLTTMRVRAMPRLGRAFLMNMASIFSAAVHLVDHAVLHGPDGLHTWEYGPGAAWPRRPRPPPRWSGC